MANLYVGFWDDSKPAVAKLDPLTMTKVGGWDGDYQSGYVETITGDGTYLYVIGANAPVEIWKVDRFTMKTVAKWTGSASQTSGAGLVCEGNYVYGVINNSGGLPSQIVKVDTASMKRVESWVEEVATYGTWMASDGTYLYLTNEYNPVSVIKIDRVTMKTVAVWTGTKGAQQSGRHIVHSGSYVYVALHGISGGQSLGRVVKINRNSMLQEAEWIGAAGETALRGLGFDGKYLYGCADSDPAKVIQINPDTMKTVLVWTGATQQDRCYDIVFDGTFAYAAMASIYAFAKVVKIRTADMVTSATWTANWTGISGESKAYAIFYDGIINTPALNQTVNTYRTSQEGRPIPPQLMNTEKDGTGDWYIATCNNTGHQKVRAVEDFGGAIYVKQNTSTTDGVRRFETVSKKLRDVKITVTIATQVFGTVDSQTFSVASGGTLQLSLIDISTLYFKNATPSGNGTVDIIGVAE